MWLLVFNVSDPFVLFLPTESKVEWQLLLWRDFPGHWVQNKISEKNSAVVFLTSQTQMGPLWSFFFLSVTQSNKSHFNFTTDSLAHVPNWKAGTVGNTSDHLLNLSILFLFFTFLSECQSCHWVGLFSQFCLFCFLHPDKKSSNQTHWARRRQHLQI